MGCLLLCGPGSERALTQEMGAGPPAAVLDSADALSRQAVSAYEEGTREGLERAIPLFARAADLYRRVGAAGKQGEALTNAAFLHNNLGRADSALAYYALALPQLRHAGDRKAEAAALTQIGEAYHGVGRLDSAVTYYRQALRIAVALQDREEQGYALNNIGIAYNALGRPDSALAYLARALATRRQIGDLKGQGVTLNNIARVHQGIGRPDSAVVYLHQSLEIRRGIADRGGEGVTLNNLAFSFELLRADDSALIYYREALPVLNQAGRRSTAGITLANMGRVYLTLGRYDSALTYLNQGLAIKRDVGDRAGETWALDDIGRVYQAIGQSDTAVVYLRQALALLREVGDRPREGNTLYHLADTYHHRAQGRDLEVATAYYDSAAAVRAEVGRVAGGDANRLTFAEQDVQLYENWTLAWLARAPEVGAERAAWAGLATTERGRAQALLDLMRGTSHEAAAGRDQSADGSRLVARATQGGTAVLSYLVTQDTLLLWVAVPGGEVVVLRRAVPRDTLADLVGAFRAALGAGGLAGRGRLALRGGGPLEAAAPPGWPVRGVEAHRATSPLAFDSLLSALSRLVLPPQLAGRLGSVRELVIVPHGPVGLVPFAALSLDSTGTPLGSRYAVRYAPSLAALAEAEARPRVPAGEALVVGNPVMPTKASFGEEFSLGPLPQAEAEGRWVAQRLGTSALVGARASEAQVRGRLARAPVVHLATHGYAYAAEARARQSFIALAPGDGHDGFLTVGEVLDDPALQLSADLVVLSACQTGLGDLKQAEGTVGLQRAFLAKGARSVLVSLWSVSDDATALLMKGFYTHWLGDADHPSKAEALRRAQEAVRARPAFRDPRYWAAFQLVGAR